MEWIKERCVVSLFEVGDRIGVVNRGRGEEAIGEIVVSEPWDVPLGDRAVFHEDEAQGWHLAWIREELPGKLSHYKGFASQRDWRWYVEITYVITEQP